MGKRSNLPQTPDQRDKAFWPTPAAATQALLDALPSAVTYAEPCAGHGHLIKALRGAGHRCGWASDAFPASHVLARTPRIHEADARSVQLPYDIEVAITNTPFGKGWNDTRDDILDNLSKQVPTWLLLPWSYLATVSSGRFQPYLREVAVIGRVQWIEGSKHTSADDFAWMLFDQQHPSEKVRIHPRKARP